MQAPAEDIYVFLFKNVFFWIYLPILFLFHLFRYMLGLSVVPALLQFLGFLFLPESPRWLIQKGLTQKARRVLSQIRGNQNIDEEYDTIKSSIEEEEKDCGGGDKIVLHAFAYANNSKKQNNSHGSVISLNYGKYSSTQENTMWICCIKLPGNNSFSVGIGELG